MHVPPGPERRILSLQRAAFFVVRRVSLASSRVVHCACARVGAPSARTVARRAAVMVRMGESSLGRTLPSDRRPRKEKFASKLGEPDVLSAGAPRESPLGLSCYKPSPEVADGGPGGCRPRAARNLAGV